MMSKIIHNNAQKIASVLLQDLNTGNTTMSGNPTTDYYALSYTEEGNVLSVAMIHEIKDVSTPYFTIHVIDDINELDGELFTTDHDSLSELCNLLESIQESTEETYLKEREEEPEDESESESEFEKCLSLLTEAVRLGLLQKDLNPDFPDNVLIYREQGNQPYENPEGWYSENIFTTAAELVDDKEGQEYIRNSIAEATKQREEIRNDV